MPRSGAATMAEPDDPPHDLGRLVEVLDRHGVDYLLVGGVAALAYGANRPTEDADCVVRRERSNLDRLAAALRELDARLRVAGLSDEEARRLPVQIDAAALESAGMTTWMTDAGPFDVLAASRALTAGWSPTRSSSSAPRSSKGAGSRCGSPGSMTSSPPRSGPVGPRTRRPSLSSGRSVTTATRAGHEGRGQGGAALTLPRLVPTTHRGEPAATGTGRHPAFSGGSEPWARDRA